MAGNIMHSQKSGNLDSPKGPLTLPDGRQIRLTKWSVTDEMDCAVRVEMNGILYHAPKPREVNMKDVLNDLVDATKAFRAASESIEIPS